MLELQRQYPLGSPDNADQFTTSSVSLTERRDVGLFKMVVKDFREAELRALLKQCGITEAPLMHHIMRGVINVAWLSPRECIFMGLGKKLSEVRAAVSENLEYPYLLLDLGHQMTVIDLIGETSPALLSSLTVHDFTGARFPPDTCKRILFGEISVILLRKGSDEGFRIIVDQSNAAYAWRVLKDAVLNLTKST